jgi:hypothetical protein
MRRVDALAFLSTAVAVVAANAIAAVAIGCAIYAAGNLIAKYGLTTTRQVAVPTMVSGEGKS